MADVPKISVVTPTFNSIKTLADTIQSVLSQDHKKWEHIIVDGGSTDGTLDLLRKYPHLQWISEKDEGHYHAMNKGIDRATGDVVAILNADDCYREGSLAHVARGFVANPAWDGLFGDVIFVDGKGREIYRRKEAVFDYDVLRFSGVCYIIHPTMFLRRTAFQKIGTFRYKELKNCADYDLFLRLGREKMSIGHIPEFLVNYRWHEYGQSADERIQRNMSRESRQIRTEHGAPSGIRGSILKFLARGKRQIQKIRYRGAWDLVPGHWLLKRHMHEKTTFSSNIGLDKL
jgi:glycosyltransferase involved in cell wall biosynthesis